MSPSTLTTALSPAKGTPFLETVGSGLRALRSSLGRLFEALEARRRAQADGIALAEMSDRDLHDIGLDRGIVASVAAGRWTRDWADV